MVKLFDIIDESLIVPYRNGIKLLIPDKNRKICPNINSGFSTVKKAFQYPMNVYFMDKQSIIQNINENTLINCGFPSLKKTIGKTIAIAANNTSIQHSLEDDAKVILTQNRVISEENYIRRNDNHSFIAITFKAPWYGEEDNLIGIFGCSIVLGENQLCYLSETFQKLSYLNLLPSSNQQLSSLLPGKEIFGAYLSNQEKNCLLLSIRGMTAKMVAKNLNLSYRTVEHYLENIKFKLNVKSKHELIQKIMDNFLDVNCN